MSILGAEEVFMVPEFGDNRSVAFHNGYMYMANAGSSKIFQVDLSDMKMVEMFQISNSYISVLKVYGNTLYVSCYSLDQILSIDLSIKPYQANVFVPLDLTDNTVISYGGNVGFCGFVINNGYVYIGCFTSIIYCYHISSGNHTILSGITSFGVGIYDSYLYMVTYYPPIIIRIPLSIIPFSSNPNTKLILTASNITIIYTFDLTYTSDYVYGFETYFNNMVIIMSSPGGGAIPKIIYVNLDTIAITEKIISRTINASSWLTIYNNYIYVTCNNENNIIRVRADLTCFNDDTIIFPNNGLGWKFDINCTQPLIKIKYAPTISN
jgi:hypothetical protein